jgi:hypothetical protein
MVWQDPQKLVEDFVIVGRPDQLVIVGRLTNNLFSKPIK